MPLLEYLYALKSQQSTAIESRVAVGAKASSGIYEGDFDLLRRTEPVLSKLAGFIHESLAKAVCIANNEGDPKDVVVDFVDSWYHITNGGGFHDAHWHHGCSWCGIYYVQIGDTGTRSGLGAPNGGSRFYSPIQTGGGYRDFGNKYLDTSLDPPIQDGLLLLFPSFLLHSGLPYRGELDRVVIAFNARVMLKPGSSTARRVESQT